MTTIRKTTQNSGIMIESQNVSTTRASQAWMYLHRLYWWNSKQGLLVPLVGCSFVNVSVHACVAPLCCALFRQGSSISFSVFHQSYHICKEGENSSASVPPKEELSIQVLISSIFCEDLVPSLRDPSLNFENSWYSFKREKKPHNLWGKKTTRAKNKIIWKVCKKKR